MSLRANLKQLTQRKRLGEILLELKLLSEEQLNNALAMATQKGVLLGAYLIASGTLKESELARALSVQYGLDCIDLSRFVMPNNIRNLISQKTIEKYRFLPLELKGDILTIAIYDPLCLVNLRGLKEASQYKFDVKLCTETQFKNACERTFTISTGTQLIKVIASELSKEKQQEPQVSNVVPIFNDSSRDSRASIENLLNKIIMGAIEKQASDIHFEPQKDIFRIRQRVDGVLHESAVLDLEIAPSLLSRIKIMGGMDIAEKRQPQDGHFQIRLGNREVDFRVSTLPTMNGEKSVIRILDKNATRLDLSSVGFSAEHLIQVKKLLGKPHGVLLVTGPTGSGKTTTVYSMIREINNLSRNIVTIEDPVEFQIENVNQVQVNTKSGVHFASTLRSVLRQDPDVIMIGEIRDQETAEIAIRSALTGHLVISTLHTNSASGAIIRLREMGIEPFLLSSSISGVIAQRLVRRLCPHCKEQSTLTENEREMLGAAFIPENAVVYRPRGCSHCSGLGFKGRIGIFELLELDSEIRRMINLDQGIEKIDYYLWEKMFHSLRLHGIDTLLAGDTSPEEILKETS